MPADEMKQFFHQTLVAMADTFQRATADEKMSDTMRDFVITSLKNGFNKHKKVARNSDFLRVFVLSFEQILSDKIN